MAMTTDVVPDMVKTFVAYFYRHIREKNGQPRSPPPRRRREIGSKISVWAGQDLDGYGDETVTPKHTADVLAVSRGALVGFTKRMVFPTSAADPEGGQHVYAVYEIQSMYETSFHTLSERYFKASPWPTEKAIAPIVDGDHVFCLLYKEMWYRHLYARTSPTLEQRCESWDNYCALFGVILHGNVNMQLPNIWLSDMVDEFIYQFQSFCQYRGKLSTKTPEELELLKRCDQVWNVLGVLNYLQALIDKSGIVETLEKERQGEVGFSANEGYDYASSNVLRLLGYFSMVGLLRVHCLIGDYRSALKAVEPIDMEKSGMFTKVPNCYITTLYYTGFGQMMMKRHVEACRTLNTILMYISRTKQYHSRSNIYDQILKKNEQIYALIAICLSICPASVKHLDEAVQQVLREKYNDKMSKMASGDLGLYDELFAYACPKFITPCPPSFDGGDVIQEAFRLQLDLFLQEVKPQAVLPTVRSYLKLYTTISIGKLATLLELDDYTVRSTLLLLKQQHGGETDFWIDGDMIHVVDNKAHRQFGEYFASHIQKFDAMCIDLGKISELVTELSV